MIPELQEFLFTTDFLIWLPKVWVWASFGIATLLYGISFFRPDFFSDKTLRRCYFWLIVGLIAMRLGYAGLATWGQYYIWDQSPFTKLLLRMGLERDTLGPILGSVYGLFDDTRGYFKYYVIGRFWINATLAVLSPLVLVGVIKLFLKLRGTILENWDMRIMLIMGLAIGWPKFVIFVPLMLLIGLILAVLRKIIGNDSHFVLAEAMIIAAGILLFGTWDLVDVLGLTVLRI